MYIYIDSLRLFAASSPTGFVAQLGAHWTALLRFYCDALMLRCMCPSVCDESALWSRCMPGRGEGSSRTMLATTRLSSRIGIKFWLVNFFSILYLFCFCTQIFFLHIFTYSEKHQGDIEL